MGTSWFLFESHSPVCPCALISERLRALRGGDSGHFSDAIDACEQSIVHGTDQVLAYGSLELLYSPRRVTSGSIGTGSSIELYWESQTWPSHQPVMSQPGCQASA